MRKEGERLIIEPASPKSLLAVLATLAPLDEGFRTRIEKVYSAWRESLEAAFARGIKSGKVRKSISPRNVAAFVVAALAGIIGTAKNSQSGELMKQAGECLFDYLDNLRP